MTTKKLYKILDKVLPQGLVYNVRKLRSIDVWRVQVWSKEELDRKRIFASYVEGELYPNLSEQSGLIADFQYFCNLVPCKKRLDFAP